MKRFLLFFLLPLAIAAHAGTVDTVMVYSNAMHRPISCVVIKPDTYKKKGRTFPTVYLLHGYSGKYSNWIMKVPALKQLVDDYQLIIVCPDGGYAGWYIDSPVDSLSKYETYVGTEVPDYIDAHYKTIKDRNARAITGLSMGGHGGLYLGFRHADTFGACGSMSGGVDLRPFPKNWEISKVLGDSAQYPANWENYSVVTIARNKPSQTLAIIIDCGVDDFFYPVNQALHVQLLAMHIQHDYITRPGQHDWAYWSNAVLYQLLYFKNFFAKMKR